MDDCLRIEKTTPKGTQLLLLFPFLRMLSVECGMDGRFLWYGWGFCGMDGWLLWYGWEVSVVWMRVSVVWTNDYG